VVALQTNSPSKPLYVKKVKGKGEGENVPAPSGASVVKKGGSWGGKKGKEGWTVVRTGGGN